MAKREQWSVRVIYGGRTCWVATSPLIWQTHLVYEQDKADVWRSRAAADRCAKAMANEGYDVEVVDVGL